MKLYLVRHGESEGNAGHFCQDKNTKLTDIGHSQAKLIAHRFKTVPIDIILTSHYLRTRQTAKAIVDATDCHLEVQPLLHEQKKPSEIEGQPHLSRKVQKYHQLNHKHGHDPDWHYSDEENYYDMAKRINRLLKSISQRSESSICAVTHGNVLRAIITAMLFGSEPTYNEITRVWDLLATKNTGITLCDYNEVTKDDKWHLVTWNDHAHLG